jgi:hypothetical protein
LARVRVRGLFWCMTHHGIAICPVDGGRIHSYGKDIA